VIVEVAAVDYGVRTLLPDQLEDRACVGAEALVTDERDGEIDRGEAWLAPRRAARTRARRRVTMRPAA
jgi:hypothetical protein